MLALALEFGRFSLGVMSECFPKYVPNGSQEALSMETLKLWMPWSIIDVPAQHRRDVPWERSHTWSMSGCHMYVWGWLNRCRTARWQRFDAWFGTQVQPVIFQRLYSTNTDHPGLLILDQVGDLSALAFVGFHKERPFLSSEQWRSGHRQISEGSGWNPRKRWSQ